MEWTRDKRTSLDTGGYTEVSYMSETGEIVATPTRVTVDVSVTNYLELEPLAKALSDAWKDHMKLRGAIREKIMGN